jgi:hypothetical protein
MQLIEEFTSEDENKCAQQDPAFNALLANNSSNVIALKYEMMYPNFGGDIANSFGGQGWAREQYYSNYVNFQDVPLPYGLQDGKIFLQAGNIDTGKLYNLKQADINNRALATSPFSINLTHWFNATFDTIFVSATIIATQPFVAYDTTIGKLKFNLAIVEKEIHIKNATGTNTLHDFYNTVRVLLPTGPMYHGINIPNIWSLGQTYTITQKRALNFNPLYKVYDYSQLSSVGFIQDDGYHGDVNKFSVLQSAQSALLPMPVTMSDIGIENITPLPLNYCQDSVAPTFKVTNYTAPTITMFSIDATTNNFTTTHTQIWSGVLQKDSSAIVVFPRDTLSQGANKIIGVLTSSNGHIIGNSTSSFANKYDFNCSNNLSNSILPNYYSVQNSPKDTTLRITFDYPDEPYTIINPKQVKARIVYDGVVPGATNWLGAYANSEHSFAWNFINMRDYTRYKAIASIVVNKIQLVGKINTGLSFDYAYAKENSSNNDTLEVQASIDCGDHWQTVWLKSGTALATAPDDSIGYFAPTANQWQSALIDLTAYDNVPDLMIRFNGIEDGGNMLYIDNINLKAGLFSSAESLSEANTQLLLSPNPSSDFVSLRLSSLATIKSVAIYNVVGSLEYNQNSDFNNINISALTSGIYFIKAIDVNGKVYTNKLVKQ